jgi:hypothetical protein
MMYDTAHIGCMIAVNRPNVFPMKTNLMHYLSLIYFVNQPLHGSGMFIAHHQEEFAVYVQQLVHVICLTLCWSNLNPYCLGRKAAFFSVGI